MSRDAILNQVRASLRQDSLRDSNRADVARRRLSSPERSLIPAQATGSRDVVLARFHSSLEAHGVTGIRVATADDVPAAVASYLGAHDVSLRVRTGADAKLIRMPWGRVPDLERREGLPDDGDGAGLSHAIAGVAETGTVVLVSGPDNPTSLAFLTETHIIVLAEEQVVGSYEDAFDLVRREFGRRVLPRALNLVTGASRTGDIGGRIVMGAHGPRRLAVIIYASSNVS